MKRWGCLFGRKLVRSLCLLGLVCTLAGLPPAGAAGEAFNKELSGAIDGKYGIRMTLQQEGSVVRGQLVYTRYGKPIKVEGSIDEAQNISVTELDQNGKPTGIFRGRFVEPGKFAGTWSKPDGSKSMPFEVTASTSPSPPAPSTAPAAQPDQPPAVSAQSSLLTQAPPPAAASSVPAPVSSAQIEEKKVVVKCPSRIEPASITCPVVKGLEASIQSKAQSALSLKSVLDTSIEALQGELNCWLDKLSYEVNYNKDFILDISFSMTGAGAYTSTTTRNVVVSLKTGQRLKAADLFLPSALAPLARKINDTMQADILKTIQEVRKNQYDVEHAFEGSVFDVANLDSFSVGEKGLTFIYRFEFPQAIKSIEPSGRYFFSYEQLKPFIKPDGPLAVFLR